MLKFKFNLETFSAALALTMLALLLFVVNTKLKLNGPTKTNNIVMSPPDQMQHLVFGYSETIANLFWIRVIQDFDFCDKKQESDKVYVVCTNKSWLFKILNLITDLSPQFRMPYSTGGLALSVLITDVDGASAIFDKAVLQFPRDWQILYRAAYHNMIENKDFKKAAFLLIEANKNGGPDWLVSLAGRMYVQGGNMEMAQSLIKQLRESEKDGHLNDYIRRIEERIRNNK